MQSTEKNAFTLLELLVVIAIVAVISALTFPVISTLRSKGESTECLAKLRKLAAAAMLYEGENGGSMPTIAGDPALIFYNSLAPYLDVEPLLDKGDDNTKIAGSFNPKTSPFVCTTQYKLHAQYRTFSENLSLRRAALAWGSSDNSPIRRLELLSRDYASGNNYTPLQSSTVPYFMDGFYDGSVYRSYRNLDMGTGSANLKNNQPHSGGCNVVFLDGHAELKPVTDDTFWKRRIELSPGGANIW